MKLLRAFWIMVMLSCVSTGYSQQNVTTVGVMIKPIVPSNVFRAGDITIQPERTNLNFEMTQTVGHSFGMIIRKGVTKNWTFETGISFTRRNFRLDVEDTDINYKESSEYGIIGYELPLMALLNIQLDKKIYMNTAFGTTVDMFPSNVTTSGDNFVLAGLRNNWLQASLIANIGWEYRTRKDGTLYIGGSYHRPFFPMYTMRVQYVGDTYIDDTFADVSGNYLTIDFRYFFHEDPEKRKSRKQRKEEKENPILYNTSPKKNNKR